MKLTAIAILITPALTLLGTTLALFTEAGRSAILNPGAHGFSEVLYAFSSAANNNGSAFARLNSNNLFYNITLSIVMFVGRFGLITAVMAIAGIMVKTNKKGKSASPRALPITHSWPINSNCFRCWLVNTNCFRYWCTHFCACPGTWTNC